MNPFLKTMNELEADGVDFHPIFTTPPDCQIIQSNTKEEFEYFDIAVPRTAYTFWKMVDGEKQYIILDDKKQESANKSYEFRFGDKVLYVSPQNPDVKTPCIFIRDDNGKAVIIFQNAEWVARANYDYLM